MRTIVIGDVHGCTDELQRLVTEVSPREDDRFIFLGDIVGRGPDCLGTLRRVRAICEQFPTSLCIAGNHEFKAIARQSRRDQGKPINGKPGEPWEDLAGPKDWSFLRTMPLLHKEPGVAFVHGGFFPRFFKHHPDGIEQVMDHMRSGRDWRKGGGKLLDRARRFLMVRHINSDGEFMTMGANGPNDPHWSDIYGGREGFVYFAHDALPGPPVPRVSRHALGLDTGCVTGGALTAAVYDGDPKDYKLIVVPAARKYADPLVERANWFVPPIGRRARRKMSQP